MTVCHVGQILHVRNLVHNLRTAERMDYTTYGEVPSYLNTNLTFLYYGARMPRSESVS
jgi:hypothetical protein